MHSKNVRNLLEDELTDIINKAAKGKQIALPNQTDIEKACEKELADLAATLDLNASALKNLYTPFKHITLPKEVEMITSSFGHLGVNAFHIRYNNHSILIDTGTEVEKISYLDPDQILITHCHPDHIACLPHFSCLVKTPKDNTNLSNLNIRTFDVSGHCNPSLAYFFPDLQTPCCFVGDAIFLRSIGGTRSSADYTKLISNNRKLLSTLPPETILCTGHGPNTTVSAELSHNPFLSK